jgi:hypothetical protein
LPQALNGALRRLESSPAGPASAESRPSGQWLRVLPGFACPAPRDAGKSITFQRALNQIAKRRDKPSPQTGFWGKTHRRLEQKDVVAVGSQLRMITGPALALSNQNEATLFDLMW